MNATRYTAQDRREAAARSAAELAARRATYAAGTFDEYLSAQGVALSPSDLVDFDADLAADYRSDYDAIVAEHNPTPSK